MRDEFDKFFFNESMVACLIQAMLKHHSIFKDYECCVWSDATQKDRETVYICIPELDIDYKITVESCDDARPTWDCEFRRRFPKT